MIVLVESNFVLEIALRQEEAADAIKILELAEKREIRCVVPAYALVEPFHKLGRARRERRALVDNLGMAVAQMSRSSDFADIGARSTEVLAAIAAKSDADEHEFNAVCDRILRCAEIIPMTADQLRAGMTRQLIDLGPQDALVFSAVQQFLDANTGHQSVFINKNAKDFLKQSVSDDLAKLGCKVLVKISSARSFIENELKKRDASAKPQ